MEGAITRGCYNQSHLANVFKVTLRTEEDQRPKRLRGENNQSPDIFVETPSTAALVEESRTVKPKLLSPETHNQKRNNYLAIKLNHLRDKQTRLESHKEFLSHCIADGRTHNLKSWPKFSRYWYSKLKQFLVSLMKDKSFNSATKQLTQLQLK